MLKIFKDKKSEIEMELWAIACMHGKTIHDKKSPDDVTPELEGLYDYIDYHTYSFAKEWLEDIELRDISFIRQQFPWMRPQLHLQRDLPVLGGSFFWESSSDVSSAEQF